MTQLVPYKGTGRKITSAEFTSLAQEYGMEVAVLRAIMEVEARGTGFYKDGRIINLYEPHIAYKYASKYKDALVKNGLAYPRWKRDYPDTSFDRIDRAAKLSTPEIAALSTSWGLGQIMGFNHKAAGYSTAVAMVKDFAESEYNQVKGMLNFIANNKKMMAAARSKDWNTFAYYYNGEKYAENRYHIKLANAYSKWSASGNKNKQTVIIDNILDMGDKGDNVGALQTKLNYLGYTIKNIDKDFGKLTETAVIKFQKDNKLKADGKAGTEVLTLLDKLYNEKKNASKSIPVLQIPELSEADQKAVEDNVAKYVSEDKKRDTSLNVSDVKVDAIKADTIKIDPVLEASIDLVKPKKQGIGGALVDIGIKILSMFFVKKKPKDK